MGNCELVKVVPRLRGATALAERLGVSPGHLLRVWRGERRSPRIEEALADLGIRVEKRRAR